MKKNCKPYILCQEWDIHDTCSTHPDYKDFIEADIFIKKKKL